MNFLSFEQQFEKILNDTKIARIEDNELQNIRYKYWKLRHEAFIDEANIPDRELENAWDRLHQDEKLEIEDYLIKHGIMYNLNWD